jgi:4-hydroxy-2-oxoglutarate aldolase
MLLEGLQLPLTTPFYPDGRLNLQKLEHNVARYSKTPVTGLVVLSENGEPSLLLDEETRQVLRTAAGAAANEKILLAGVSQDSVTATLDLAESAATFDYDAVLVKRPSILSSTPTHDGRDSTRALVTYFQIVADRAALPVVLYAAFSAHGDMLPAEVVIELAGHPNIIGLVDGRGSRERIRTILEGTIGVKHDVTVTSIFAPVTRRMQHADRRSDDGLISVDTLSGGGTSLASAPVRVLPKTRTKAVGFQLLAGSTTGIVEALRAGSMGAMPPFAASAPQACYEVLAAWKDGDEGLAEEKQVRLQQVAKRVEQQLGVAGIKFGCDLNGYSGGQPRLPRLPLTGEERTEIEALMHGLRN